MSYLLKSVRFSVLAVMFVKSVLGPPTTRKRKNTVHEQTYKTIVADTREENWTTYNTALAIAVQQQMTTTTINKKAAIISAKNDWLELS